jgi:hypothetical protein
MVHKAGALDGAAVPAVLESAMVLRGGCVGKTPVIVEPTCLSEGQLLFCQVGKVTPWLCMFSTGCSSGTRPLTSTGFADLLRTQLRQHSLRRAMAVEGTDSVSSLGFDEEDGAESQASPVKAGRKRKAAALLEAEVVEFEVPLTFGSSEKFKVQVLNRQLRDSIWLRCDLSHMDWLRAYILSEIKAGFAQDKSQNHKNEHMSNVYWCSAASSWRVRFGKADIKNFYVPRKPAVTYKERVAATKALAEEHALQSV